MIWASPASPSAESPPSLAATMQLRRTLRAVWPGGRPEAVSCEAAMVPSHDALSLAHRGVTTDAVDATLREHPRFNSVVVANSTGRGKGTRSACPVHLSAPEMK